MGEGLVAGKSIKSKAVGQIDKVGMNGRDDKGGRLTMHGAIRKNKGDGREKTEQT